MSELYSITGLFHQDFPGIIPWGGYFIKENDGGECIEGKLIDIYGGSTINGKMDSNVLKFLKRYGEKNNSEFFDYEFLLVDGIWRGEFSNPLVDYRGKALCKTNLCLSDLAIKRVDMNTTEGYFRAVIDDLVEKGVEKGLFEKYKDPETGEEMIKPV